ncbi:unnamed protein product [Rotaria sp. Silwood1]|nr:unnamed protein product [Rotaria sp. Silwood1]
MHYDLRLSVALQMTPANGIGALINYSRPIDKYTRFLLYNYYSRTEYFEDDEFTGFSKAKSRKPDTLATHVIVFINWGIDAVILLQLPADDEQVQAIDYALENVCLSLNNDYTTLTLSEQDMPFLEKILHTEIFSNISALTRINSITDFHRNIPSVRLNSSLLKPYNYNLYPIDYLYAVNNEKQVIFIELKQDGIVRIESYLLHLSLTFKKLNRAMDQDYRNLQQHLKIELNKMRTAWRNLKEMYTNEIHRVRNLVLGIRRGEIDQTKIPNELSNDQVETMTKKINEFTNYLNTMDKKEQLIKDLTEKQFIYQNAIDRDIQYDDDRQTLERKLLADAKHTSIICSNDHLYKTNRSQWYTLCGQLLKEHEENPELQLIYVDFSYCLCKLHDIIILPATEKKNNATLTPPVTTPPQERPTSDKSLNILLLGESGVGKSTFINAFVNYLKFDKLKQAEKNPVVLIPVSFAITIDDNFTEQVVKFEGNDTLSNEDHDNLGHSVTQHCKSYVFTLKDGNHHGRKLRIIDTPGIGDTHGSGQDDVNLQHILSYITNLTHLNAICILLKPNNTRLNIFFRLYFMQLIDLLGENACDKIIFCFTNSRSTFYTPGNTAPALKTLLDSLLVKKIPFTRENTFCFDNESFRYLVARLNKIKFKDIDEREYNDSWEKSSAESNRLLQYIRTKMSIGIIPDESHSTKHVQLKINLMIRPMLEAMRNILRNLILWNARSSKVYIELYPKIIKGTTAICLKCSHDFAQVADFWITTYGLHIFHNRCRTCRCDPSDHYPIDYELGYKRCDDLASNSEKSMTQILDDLYQTSAGFANFLVGASGTSNNDPFLLGLERMIKEEDEICAKKSSYELNLNLTQELEELKRRYEKTRKRLTTKKELISLDDIYQKIENVSKYRMIELQMVAIKQWRKFMVKYYEHEVLF